MKRVFACLIIVTLFVLMLFCENNSLVDYVSKCGYSDLKIVNKGDCQMITIDQVDNVENIIKSLSVEVHSVKDLQDRKIIEGYTNYINSYILIDGVKTNIQISAFDSKVIIGSPLISESF